MPPDLLADARDWLRYAEEDLASCRVLLHAEQALLASASYHAHQAAEKSLKSFLIANQQPLLRTHDLGALVSRCERLDESFAALADAAARRTPYAVLHSYPGAAGYPELSDVELAYADADGIVKVVRRKLWLAGATGTA